MTLFQPTTNATPTATSHTDHATYATGVTRSANFQPASRPPTNSSEHSIRTGPTTTPATPNTPGTADDCVSATPASSVQAPGERVAEVLADGDAEVAVGGLEDDVDRLAARGAHVGLGVGAGEIRHEERPAHEPQELHERGEDADHGCDGEQGGVGVADRLRQQDDERDHQHGGQRERPPREHELGAAGPEALEHLAGRAAQDVGVVEARGEHARTRR